MAINMQSMLTTAERLIGENGRSMTLVKKPTSVADSSKPWRGGGSSGKTVAKAVMEDYKSWQFGEEILRGDKKVLLCSTGLAPITDYFQILDGADTWSIVGYSEEKPGPTSVLYVFQVRK